MLTIIFSHSRNIAISAADIQKYAHTNVFLCLYINISVVLKRRLLIGNEIVATAIKILHSRNP